MTPETVFFAYVALSLGALGTLAIYDRAREKRFGPMPSEDQIFRCDQCGFVYTDDADVDRSRCSQCGTLNESIKF